MQERFKSIANALELRLSCTNPSICGFGETIAFSLGYMLLSMHNRAVQVGVFYDR